VSLRIAVLSVHTCPLAVLGGKETGGMNVYVRELARELGRMRVTADIFTRSQNPAIPRVVRIGDGVRVVHLSAGPQAPMPRERVYDHLDDFTDGVEAFRIGHGIEYDLIHAHYWLSGSAGLTLRDRWGVPLVQMFHTLGRLKNDATRNGAEREPDLRIAEEARIVAAADRIVAATVVERAHLVSHYLADAARIAVIPCGVDTELFAPGDQAAARATLGLDDRPRLLYVGRLAPIKGLSTLLDGMARLRAAGSRAQLCIVGGDADRAGSRDGRPRPRPRFRGARRGARPRPRRSRPALAPGPRGRAVGRPASLALRGRGRVSRVRGAGGARGVAPGRGALQIARRRGLAVCLTRGLRPRGLPGRRSSRA
jgi:D-inositol-3-phosphate glycosyltransferase